MRLNKDYIKGVAKVKKYDYKKAIVNFTKAIEENTADVESYAERAVCYLHLKQYDLSMFDMNKAIELEPNYSYRYSCRAYLKGSLKDMQGAVDDYQRAVDLDPKDIIALNNLGIAQENLGYYKKAQGNFKKSNELLGYDPENREIVGNIAVDKKKYGEPDEDESKKTSSKSKGRIMINVFSKKADFKDFVRFVGKGFKLKDNDKKGKG